MAIKIAGLSQADALEQFGVSRATMSRYRNDPHWPGDDAPFNMLATWIRGKKGPAGRKKKETRANPPTVPTNFDEGVEFEDESAEEQEKQWELSDRLKLSQIEKNNTQIKKYQLACMAKHRADLMARINKGLDRLFDTLEELDLTHDQVAEIRNKIREIGHDLNDEPGDFQPELITTKCKTKALSGGITPCHMKITNI
jgi:transcriptional regulator with XRE-family HTH domain